MPMKPTKRGFKVWVIACCKTGYNLGFKIYEGKDNEGNKKWGLGERTILQMSEPYMSKGYCLYFDNFFSSFPLLKELIDHNTFACGTFRTNRKYYPSENLKSDKSLKPSDYDFCMSDDFSVCKWKDRGKKSVVIVSSFHDPSNETTVLRTNSKGERDRVKCSIAISDYNNYCYMGGVDKFNQLIETYNIAWKSRRWWMKLFYFFIDSSIVKLYFVQTSYSTN